MKNKILSLVLAGVSLFSFSATYVEAASVTPYRTVNAAGWEKKTPRQNLFQIDGSLMEFVLLDELEDGFLVITNTSVGRKPFDTDNTGKFDIEDTNNIAYWLNNDYLTTQEDGIKYLPAQITDNLVQHEWLTEAGAADTDFNEDYITKSKLALMSHTEWVKYYYNGRKFGNDGCGYWYLRTSDGLTKQSQEMYKAGVIVATELGTEGWGKAVTGGEIRPIFVVDKEFFGKVKLNVKQSGSNVLQTMKDKVTEKELIKLYGNKNIIKEIDSGIRPIVSNVGYLGITVVGRTLNGYYTYSSPNGRKEKGSIFRWLRSDSEDGIYTTIPGANGKTYTLTKEDENKYIKFEVFPKSTVNIGYPVRSAAWKIEPESVPYTTDVKIMGEYSNDSKLYADYHCTDDNNEPVINTYFKWQVSDNGVDFKDIENATEQSFIPDKQYCGKYIRVSVQNEKLGEEKYIKGNETYSEPVPINSKPEVKSVNITGQSSFAGNYEYSEPMNIQEGNSLCEWEISKSSDGEYKKVALGKALNISETAEDCYLRFSVTPVNQNGICGEKKSSAAVKISKNVNSKNLKKEINISNNAVIKCEKSSFYSGGVVIIKSDSELEFESNVFDVISTRNGNIYILTLAPKDNSDMVYVKDMVLNVKAKQSTGVTISSAIMQGISENVAVGFE